MKRIKVMTAIAVAAFAAASVVKGVSDENNQFSELVAENAEALASVPLLSGDGHTESPFPHFVFDDNKCDGDNGDCHLVDDKEN